jgi:uncharacterized protein
MTETPQAVAADAQTHTAQLLQIVRSSPWMMSALQTVRSLGLQQGCIGAGAVRNLVWDHLHGHSQPSVLADVDVAYFEPNDLSTAAEQAVQNELLRRATALPWEATNQAAVHLWFEGHFGHAVAPLKSLEEAVASWPEYATSVAVWLDEHDALHLIAPHGLADLFEMRVRRNPVRVSVDTYRQRCAQKRYLERWPRVSVELC